MDDCTLTLTRFIAAPPEVVWRCWTDPRHLPQWFGPDGYSCQTKEIDLRQGGVWRFDMIGPDGTIYPNRHRITLYDRPNQINFLLDADDDSHPAIKVQVTLTAEGGGTRLIQNMEMPSVEALKGALAFGADRLGAQTMAKLVVFAEALEV